MSDNWISVKDKLPELTATSCYDKSSVYVLVFDGNCIYVGYLYILDDEYGPEWIQFGRDGYKIDNATHWMPLPEFPK